jgi:hypothetical protein
MNLSVNTVYGNNEFVAVFISDNLSHCIGLKKILITSRVH